MQSVLVFFGKLQVISCCSRIVDDAKSWADRRLGTVISGRILGVFKELKGTEGIWKDHSKQNGSFFSVFCTPILKTISSICVDQVNISVSSCCTVNRSVDIPCYVWSRWTANCSAWQDIMLWHFGPASKIQASLSRPLRQIKRWR